MLVLKCKMCGADIQAEEGATTAKCGFCRTLQTVPVIKSDNEDLRGLYNRANILRLKCEFDKAEDIYEKILLKDDTQSEAYYGVLLCKYGIEYVDDPASGRRIPTCHRASYEALTADEYYKLALKNASPEQREIYQSEAAYIDGVQRQILAESSLEEPYDVFICYKESDNGARTRDSVIANDIYRQLTAEGFKVFYSAVTLEDKLGSNYEPVIFSALNSAKVMLAIGTKPEYLNAVWVRNEWSRYLKILKNDRRKLLIPCYKDMDAYELPEEFAHLQAQDMGKIGFITDIIRGIKKVLESFKEKPAVNNITNVTNVTNRTTNVTGGNASAAPAAATLLERAFMFAEDGDFVSADRYAEKVLDANPKEAEAYLVKLLAELRINKRENLQNLSKPFTASKNCEKVLRFGDAELKKEIEGYNFVVLKRKEEKEAELAREELRRKEEIRLRKEKALIWRNAASKMLVAGLNHIVGLKSDGTVIAKRITDFNAGQCSVDNWYDIKEVYASLAITVGLKFDNTVVLAGDYKESYGCSVEDWHGIKAVSIGATFIVGLKNDGTVLATGCNVYNQSVSGWRNIKSIVSGKFHTVGLKEDGTVVAAGDNREGQCNVSSWKNIAKIYAHQYSTFGITNDGRVIFVGKTFDAYNSDAKYDFSDCTEWRDIVKLAISSRTIIGLKSNGTVVALGDNSKGQCNVSEWKDVVDIAIEKNISDAGGNFTIGLTSTGKVLYTGPSNGRTAGAWKDIISICSGVEFFLGLAADGKIYAVGLDNNLIENWKLFKSIETIEQESKEERAKAAEIIKKKIEAEAEANAKLQTEMRKLEQERSELAAERSKLGIFSGKRKKEISLRIYDIIKEIEQLKAQLK